MLLSCVVDEEVCNPLKVWHNMDEPESRDAKVPDCLRTAAQPQNASRIVDDEAKMTFSPNEVICVKMYPYVPPQECGYDYRSYVR